MAETNAISYSWGGQGAASLSGSDNPTANNLQNASYDADHSATTEIDCVFAFADLKSIFILSDKNLTLKTNSSGAPDQTFTIKAGIPFAWSHNSGIANPFDTNVTKFFFVNAGATADDDASVKHRILHDI